MSDRLSLEFDIFPEIHKVRARQMISAPSSHFMYQASAACGALHGLVWKLTVTARPWLAENRQTTAVRTDEIVTG